MRSFVAAHLRRVGVPGCGLASTHKRHFQAGECGRRSVMAAHYCALRR